MTRDLSMSSRRGLGPVFAVESVLNARRLTIYAGRSLFVLVLLAGLTIVWFSTVDDPLAGTASGSLKSLASVGESFYHTLTMLELTLALLAAPAATAGAICLDRARGGLTHLLVTDLSDTEIVLGKLAARLAPVAGLLACSLPVTAMATLLGGIDAGALTWAFVICLAVALVGCSLAMTFSIWATRPHEVMMAVFACWTAVLLWEPSWESAANTLAVIPPPDWFEKLNPFILISAPYSKPGFVTASDYVVFIIVALVGAVFLNGVTIAALRRSMASHTTPQRRGWRLPRLFPGPSLERNPVLWREWHRTRPSRMSRFVWTAYVMMSLVGTSWALVEWTLSGRSTNDEALKAVVVLEVSLGLLMASVLAPSSLSEERVRASLDVVLVTPLSTRAIVVGKWLGAFRIIPWLALLPVVAAGLVACRAPSSVFPTPPITLLDRLMIPILMAAQVLSCGAAITSLGLALAIWTPRIGRAVGLCVSAYLFMAIGWPVLGQVVLRHISFNSANSVGFAFGVLGFSPVAGTVLIMQWLFMSGNNWSPWLLWLTEGICVLVQSAFASVLLWFSIRTFDRRMGRVPEMTARAEPKSAKPECILE